MAGETTGVFTDDVEHDVIGSPIGPVHGPAAAQGFCAGRQGGATRLGGAAVVRVGLERDVALGFAFADEIVGGLLAPIAALAGVHRSACPATCTS